MRAVEAACLRLGGRDGSDGPGRATRAAVLDDHNRDCRGSADMRPALASSWLAADRQALRAHRGRAEVALDRIARVPAVAVVALALFALADGLAGTSRAATPSGVRQASLNFLNLKGLSPTLSGDLLKLEKRLVATRGSLGRLERSLPKGYLKIASANSAFLKISDANAQFLKTADADAQFLKTADADVRYLPASAANSFVQGNGSVVSGALPMLASSPQQLLSLPGRIIVVNVADVPAAGRLISIHNGTANTLPGAVDMGNGSGSSALTLNPNGDTQLPAVQPSAAEIRLQIFPAGSFTNVVSILIGLTPNPSNNQQIEAVAQAFTGGV